MKRFIFLFLLCSSIKAYSAGVWDECESSFYAVSDEAKKWVLFVDSADPKELHKVAEFRLPKVSSCPSQLYFEDMPVLLQSYISETLESYEVKKEVVQGKRASAVLEAFRHHLHKRVLQKVSATVSMKVGAAREEISQEKRQIQKRLEQEKR